MNNLSTNSTVGEIAATLPLSTRTFERLGIDFCCGGKVRLADACEARKLDPDALLRSIESDSASETSLSGTDWSNEPLDRLIDHILAVHHVYLKTQLPRIETLLAKVVAAHSSRHGEVLEPVAEIFGAMKQELDAHLMKEEMVLFPLIRRLAGENEPADCPSHCGSVRNPIRVMVMEHDSAGDALARLRALTSGFTPPSDGCNTFRATYAELEALEKDLHQHIHLENNILFPRAVEREAVTV